MTGGILATVLLLVVPASRVVAEPPAVFRDCAACPEMVALPLGSFLMGAPEWEFRRNLTFDGTGLVRATPESPYVEADEGPQVRVTVDVPIAMGVNEVTYDEWMACVADGGCGGHVPDRVVGQAGTAEQVLRSLADPQFERLPSADALAHAATASGGFLTVGGRWPVVYVSYADAQAYSDWLNATLGTDAYRLPTEAEWEYAARAGTATRFAQGFEPTAEQANVSGENTEIMLMEPRPDLRTLGYPVPVDEMDAANPWGLWHMAGNVRKITRSCHAPHQPQWTTTSEWLARSVAQVGDRAMRDGAFGGPMDAALVANRGDSRETSRNQFKGVRVVMALK